MTCIVGLTTCHARFLFQIPWGREVEVVQPRPVFNAQPVSPTDQVSLNSSLLNLLSTSSRYLLILLRPSINPSTAIYQSAPAVVPTRHASLPHSSPPVNPVSNDAGIK